jgi:hypothetical protein
MSVEQCGDCGHEHQVESVVTRCTCGCRNMVKPMTNTDGAVEAAITEAVRVAMADPGCDCPGSFFCSHWLAAMDAPLRAIADTASRTATAAARGASAESVAQWTALVLAENGGIRDDGHWHAEHCPGVPAIECRCIDIENEMADYRMILDHCAAIYDEVSGGRVSKPNTLPSVVVEFMNEVRQKDIDEAEAESAQLVFDHIIESWPTPIPDDVIRLLDRIRTHVLTEHLAALTGQGEGAT